MPAQLGAALIGRDRLLELRLTAFQYGDYVAYQSSTRGVTPLDGIREASRGQVTYAQGCERWSNDRSGFPEAVAAAEAADVAVVVVGTWSRDQNELWAGVNATTGEHIDVSNLNLVGAMPHLVKAIIDTGKPTVVVFSSGRPITEPWISKEAAALVQQFYPSEQGGHALADVLFGGINPSGHLRKHLDLFANIRPAKSHPDFPARCGVPVDLVIVRENTEGFYADRTMFAGTGEFMPTEDVAIAMRKVTRQGSTRIAEAGFRIARQRGGKLTVVHKANVLRISDGLFLDCTREVARAYPDVEVEEVLVDAMAALLVRAMSVDGQISDAERETLREVLGRDFGLRGDDLDTLVADAIAAEDEAVDLYRFTSVLKRHFSAEQCRQVVQQLWEIV